MLRGTFEALWRLLLLNEKGLVIPIHFVVRARSRERTRGFVVAVLEILHLAEVKSRVITSLTRMNALKVT